MDISQNLKTVLDNISNDINVINDKVESKQAEITSENKLDYSLISGAPAGGEVVWGGISGTLSAQTDLQTALNGKANTADIPTKTSDLTNDSGFVASSVMEDALSEKQDLITEDNWLPAGYVRMDLDPWQGDPEFTVENAVNMVHEEALEALSGVDAVSGALSGKQDAITNENKLSYSLISGAPETQDAVWGGITGVLSDQTDLQDALDAKADTADIPTSTSQLNNDSDFVDAGFVASMLEGYATTDYVTSQIAAIPLPQNVSELSNDADYQSGTEVQATVEAAVSGKQDEITNDNKLSYDLISGAPTVPTSTSQLTNDSDFVTSSYVDNVISGKQDLIDGSHPIYGSVVRMDINHYEHGDPDFDVETAVNMTRDDVYAVSGVVSGLLSSKQDVITVDNKLDYNLISGAPTVPTSTSQLTNDSNFQTSTDVANAISGKLDAPSSGTEGQVLTKTANGEEWADAQGSTIKVDDKTASGVFIVDFAGAQIQKYVVESAVSGSFTVQYDNTDIPNGTAPTIELQIPVTGDVSLVNLPAKTKVIDMPEVLSGGEYMYHDIVFRAQRDMNGKVKIYANYSYNFEEEKANDNYFYFEVTEAGAGPMLNWADDDNDPEVVLNLEYSTDKVNWTEIPSSVWIDAKSWGYDGVLNVGDRLYLRGNNATINTSAMFDDPVTINSHFYNFVGGPGLNIGGNIMSLIDSEMETDEVPECCFAYLFSYAGLTSTSALILPAMTLNAHCYEGMFKENADMVDTPQILPATTLAPYCYKDMFNGCYTIEAAPEIMATTYSAGGHDMEGMFYDAECMVNLKVHFTAWSPSTDATLNWLYHAGSEGTFYCPSGLDTTTRGQSTVQNDWTVVNY